MVKRLGRKWFEIRDHWLLEAYKADAEMWRSPAARKALIEASSTSISILVVLVASIAALYIVMDGRWPLRDP